MLQVLGIQVHLRQSQQPSLAAADSHLLDPDSQPARKVRNFRGRSKRTYLISTHWTCLARIALGLELRMSRWMSGELPHNRWVCWTMGSCMAWWMASCALILSITTAASTCVLSTAWILASKWRRWLRQIGVSLEKKTLQGTAWRSYLMIFTWVEGG